MNGDGVNQDLMFIPKKATDLNFEPYTQTVNGATYYFSAEKQAAALEQFIQNTPYLRKRRGQYAERNGGSTPWQSNLTARIMQEFFVKTGNKTHQLQLSADFENFENLLNKYWGISTGTTTSQPITFRNFNENGEPVYRMQQANGELYTTPFRRNYSASATWRVQLGARYIF